MDTRSTASTCDRHGPVGDRRFLVVDEKGRFLTQRDTPRLAAITPTLLADGIELAAAGFPSLFVRKPSAGSPEREVIIWRDTVRVIDGGDPAACWLSAVLARPVRLVGLGPEFARPITKAAAQTGDEVSFADAYPLLVISEASLAGLNDRLDVPVPMNRFRPNLVVRGTPPHAEDALAPHPHRSGDLARGGSLRALRHSHH